MTQPTDIELMELDVWIAEHVMDWKWWFNVLSLEAMLQRPDGGDWPTRYGFEKQSKKPELFQTDSTDLSAFKPTTNSADAFEVLKKCAEKDDGEKIVSITKLGDSFQVSYIDWEGECREGTEKAPTLELAICRFAKALHQKSSQCSNS